MNLNDFLYLTLSKVNSIIPKRGKTITIYGRKMLNDNASTLLDYLIQQGYNEKYRINLIVTKSIWHKSYLNINNLYIKFGPINSLWCILRSKYIFHTHGMSKLTMQPKKDQIIFNLWHGSALKRLGRMMGLQTHPDSFSYFLSASPFFEEINLKCFGHTIKQSFIGSNPRNDLLFKHIEISGIDNNHQSDIYIMFMPTFRKSDTLNLQYKGISFPMITEDNISDLNTYLKKEKVTLFIKPHPYQEFIPLFKTKYSNIIIITNNELLDNNIQLYSLLGSCDALITDFSSVCFDYLLIDKPIGFLIEDISSYTSNRGFTIDNPLDYMPGMKIYNMDDLKKFIVSVKMGDDQFRSERNRVNEIANTYKTADACKRILDFVGISK